MLATKEISVTVSGLAFTEERYCNLQLLKKVRCINLRYAPAYAYQKIGLTLSSRHVPYQSDV